MVSRRARPPVGRGRRWTDNRAPAPGGRGGFIDGVVAPEVSAGNAANATLAAVAVANRASTFVDLRLSCSTLIGSFRQPHFESAFLPPLVCQTFPKSMRLESVHYGHFRLMTMES